MQHVAITCLLHPLYLPSRPQALECAGTAIWKAAYARVSWAVMFSDFVRNGHVYQQEEARHEPRGLHSIGRVGRKEVHEGPATFWVALFRARAARAA